MRERKPGLDTPRSDAQTVLVVDDVHVAFDDHVVLDGISFEVRRGTTVAILGESGGGKTVLLKTMLGLLEPQEGRVLVFGTEVGELDDDAMDPIRRRIAVVFQGAAIYGGLTVEENVALELREVFRMPEAEIAQRVKDSLAAAGLEEVEPTQMPDGLSGGMKKRLAVARAIAPSPEILFYDEPTSGLDPIHSARVFDLVQALQERMGVTSLVVSHDLVGACRVANVVFLLAKGKIAFSGSPEEFSASTDPAIVAFRSASPGFGAPAATSPPTAVPESLAAAPSAPAAPPAARRTAKSPVESR